MQVRPRQVQIWDTDITFEAVLALSKISVPVEHIRKCRGAALHVSGTTLPLELES